MRLLGAFAGIGGLELGAKLAGIDVDTVIEIDPHCQRLLAHHYPNAQILGDIRHVSIADVPRRIDIMSGGFPCQDVSIAGKRAGLSGQRSGLWFEFLRLATGLKPDWLVIENVPGLLTTNQGRDFATILNGLVKIGYCVAWRELDSRNFGLAQQRKRLYIVASLGNGRAIQVLFIPESGGGDIEASRTAQSEITAIATPQSDGNQGGCEHKAGETNLVPVLANPLSGLSNSDIAHTLTTKDRFNPTQDNFIAVGNKLRRLTPKERELLQGFPNGWTAGYSDTQRNAMLGNAVSVPVAEWIFKRILLATP